MNNTRFATNIHIMTLLAKEPEKFLTSEWIAGSININPVIVRKELIILKKFGLIESRQGKDGGARILKNAVEISITEIYEVVRNSEILGKKNLNPNPKCTVGKDINKNLNVLFSETENVVQQFLMNKKLSDFMNQFD
ncbi:MAG TPA: Rrf2 family transcriptional regulator [Kaistella chaponensis]|uniref:Transcriptional regulator, BadM/Rrf2 family n=1 Tax=Kaistella chaponensis TaxID=713588 RepID=A0A1N7NNQ0_9FLAO|nr:Rrf2 family transcriptional regulator [Kaistella chaponensis]SIT00033.1 transcriptional regulator, BadM/Rrf2 family [Kaistella chaponensis]HQC07549.1 Rrf2 family transcriptional regulator [Kaistella chaponensis]